MTLPPYYLLFRDFLYPYHTPQALLFDAASMPGSQAFKQETFRGYAVIDLPRIQEDAEAPDAD